MRIYLLAETDADGEFIVLDSILCRTVKDDEIRLTWDEADSVLKDGMFDARYKGIYAEIEGVEDYTNGYLFMLEGMTIEDVVIDSDNNMSYFNIVHLVIEDGDDELIFVNCYSHKGGNGNGD